MNLLKYYKLDNNNNKSYNQPFSKSIILYYSQSEGLNIHADMSLHFCSIPPQNHIPWLMSLVRSSYSLNNSTADNSLVLISVGYICHSLPGVLSTYAWTLEKTHRNSCTSLKSATTHSTNKREGCNHTTSKRRP